MITFKISGDFSQIENYLKKQAKGNNIESLLRRYGDLGVQKLSSLTPIDTGKTSQKWKYVLDKKEGYYSLSWHNENISEGIPIVILIQYGHATKSGSWIEGTDFINPSIKPVFEELIQELWKEV